MWVDILCNVRWFSVCAIFVLYMIASLLKGPLKSGVLDPALILLRDFQLKRIKEQ